MKKIMAIGAAAFAGFLASAPAQAQTVLTMSSWVPPGHPITANMLVPWAQQVEKATQGRVKINLLPKAPVAPPQTFDAVRDGLMDVSFTVHGYTPGRFVLTKMAEFPFLGDSAEATAVAFHRVYEKHLAKHDEHKGVKVLGMFTHGPGQIYTTKKPISKVDDLAGMKIRVGGGVVNDVTKALGPTPLLKPASESFEILNSGVADGIFFPQESIKNFKLTKVIRHATFVPGGLYNTSFVLMMNPAKFAGLSKADQDAIMSVSGENFARLSGKAWDAADDDGVKAMKADGIAIQTASPAFVAEIQAKTGGIEKAWIEDVKAKGVDGAAVMADFRAEIKKLSGK